MTTESWVSLKMLLLFKQGDDNNNEGIIAAARLEAPDEGICGDSGPGPELQHRLCGDNSPLERMADYMQQLVF